MNKKHEIFYDFYSYFESDALAAYCMELVERLPASSWEYELGEWIKDMYRACFSINEIFKIDYVKKKVPKPKQRDCIRIATLLYGAEPNKTVIVNWLKRQVTKQKIKPGLTEYIGNLICPLKESEEYLYIQLAYGNCSSDAEPNEKMRNLIKEIAFGDPENWFFPSGEYNKCNFWLVYEMDKGYLKKLKKKGSKIPQPLRSYLETYIK